MISSDGLLKNCGSSVLITQERYDAPGVVEKKKKKTSPNKCFKYFVNCSNCLIRCYLKYDQDAPVTRFELEKMAVVLHL